ncbi:MAG: BON domain-containing protein [Alphaproteobacteria bacterium]|jgi:osmotically-inducible protein OsmY|nr:BON domain-containing protein [Candidatus Jidaibacter sp.]
MRINNLVYKSIGAALGSFALLMSLTSCLPMAAAGTAAVGTSIVEERSVGDKLDDTVIVMKVKDKMAQAEFDELLSRISVDSHEGRVLLTGFVTEEKYSKEASDITWKTAGVKEVINEINVGKRDLKDYAKELFIANTIRSKILVDQNIRSSNYKVDVMGNTVYLLGVAQNQDELTKVIDISRSVKGVGQVVNHVVLKDDFRRKKKHS